MSYNISALRVRSIDLKFPLDFNFQAWLQTQPDQGKQGYENTGKRWCIQSENRVQVDLSQHTWELDFSNQSLSGVIADNQLITHKIEWTDEGSGHMYEDILIPLFEQFKGNFSALVVWEGGDTIHDLKIVDGDVDEAEVD